MEPDTPSVGGWYPVSSRDGLSTVTPGYNRDFSLKCDATDIHSVIVGTPLLAASQQNGEWLSVQYRRNFQFRKTTPKLLTMGANMKRTTLLLILSAFFLTNCATMMKGYFD
ncbi:MAG: hypothetical protein AB7W47_14630 [Calditrichaceae bacterium]